MQNGQTAQRAATVICYLNRVAGGGATWFCRSTGCPATALEPSGQRACRMAPYRERPGVRSCHSSVVPNHMELRSLYAALKHRNLVDPQIEG